MPALIVILLALVGACSQQDGSVRITAQTLAKTEALLEDAALTEAALNPELTSQLGFDDRLLPDAKSQLSEVSQAAFERQRLLRMALTTRLSQAPNLPQDQPLARDLRLTRFAMRDLIQLQASGKGHLSLSDQRVHTIDPFSGLWIEGPQTLVRDHIIETTEDADVYISRMTALADGLQDTRRRLLADAATGHLPSKALLRATRMKIDRFLDENILAAIPQTLKSFSLTLPADNAQSHEDRMRLAGQVYQTEMLPAYRDLSDAIRILEDQAPIPLGLWTQPGGVTLYNDLLQVHADDTARVNTLWPTLERAISDLEASAPIETGPVEDDLVETTSKSIENEGVTSDTSDLRALITQAARTTLTRQQVPLSVTQFLGLQRLEARYDNRRPAIIIYDQDRLYTLPKPLLNAILSTPYIDAARIYDTAVRTGAQRSAVRAYIQDDAFEQAWRTYFYSTKADSTLEEDYASVHALDLFQTALAKADLGLHAKRWSLSDTTGFLISTIGISESLANEAALRLAANPGHAVGVYVHTQRFRSLETRARQVLGPRFDLSAFHSILISDGSRPLSLVERDVELWYQGLIETR
ncbi:MAG: DUF885 family protein [Pseudomonadota bacterium]